MSDAPRIRPDDRPDDLSIRPDDLSGPAIRALLQFHAAGMEAASPPGSCHYFDVDELRQPEVTVWSAWSGADLAGCGALLELSSCHGEIKSMRTSPDHLGRGVGRAVLGQIIDEATTRGYERLSLETGRTDDFAAAVRLYETFGFGPCGPFGDHVESEFSRYFTRTL